MRMLLTTALLVLAGCMDGAANMPKSDEDLPKFRPDPHEVPYREGGGGPTVWRVTAAERFWEAELDPAGDAITIALLVAPRFPPDYDPPPFNGSGWIVRLSGNDDQMEKPPQAQWHRWVELQHDSKRNLSHPMEFDLPELEGEEVVFRFSLRKVHESGQFTAVYWLATYRLEDGVYHVSDPFYQFQGCNPECSWSNEHRDHSPPPPFNW